MRSIGYLILIIFVTLATIIVILSNFTIPGVFIFFFVNLITEMVEWYQPILWLIYNLVAVAICFGVLLTIKE